MKNDRSFNLSINPNIQELTEEILNSEEIKSAENIAKTLLWEGHRELPLRRCKI